MSKKIVKTYEEFSAGSLENSKIFESSLSRIWQHIEGGSGFGVISPFRKKYSISENLERYKELKHIIRNDLKLGYIELEGGFVEEGSWVIEKSLFIPKISREDLINLGQHFEQYSVIYKDEDEFVELGTNDISGVGNVLTDFIKNGWENNMKIDSQLAILFFSKLAKGSHRDRKFIFNVKESYLLERDESTFNDRYRASVGKLQNRYIRLL